jgi:spore coat protein U-like protein
MSLKHLGIICLLVNLCYVKHVDASCTGINCSCTVATVAVNFGTYNPQSATNTTANGTLNITCTSFIVGLISYTMKLSTGGSGVYTNRHMINGSTPLLYNLYTSAAFTSIWGDGTGGSVQGTDSNLPVSSIPTLRAYTVYGSMTALQTSAIAGTYTDTVVVTVTY